MAALARSFLIRQPMPVPLKTPKTARSLESCNSPRMFPVCSRFYPCCRLFLAGRFCSRADRPEVVALRHQLNALCRHRPGRPRLSSADRLLQVWLHLLWPRCLPAEQRLHLVCGSDRNSPRFVAPRRYWFLPLLKFGSDGIFSKDRTHHPSTRQSRLARDWVHIRDKRTLRGDGNANQANGQS